MQPQHIYLQSRFWSNQGNTLALYLNLCCNTMHNCEQFIAELLVLLKTAEDNILLWGILPETGDINAVMSNHFKVHTLSAIVA